MKGLIKIDNTQKKMTTEKLLSKWSSLFFKAWAKNFIHFIDT
jgi:hypothetical protein